MPSLLSYLGSADAKTTYTAKLTSTFGKCDLANVRVVSSSDNCLKVQITLLGLGPFKGLFKGYTGNANVTVRKDDAGISIESDGGDLQGGEILYFPCKEDGDGNLQVSWSSQRWTGPVVTLKKDGKNTVCTAANLPMPFSMAKSIRAKHPQG